MAKLKRPRKRKTPSEYSKYVVEVIQDTEQGLVTAFRYLQEHKELKEFLKEIPPNRLVRVFKMSYTFQKEYQT